mmetsp:Transcript_22226/g.30911  ORF Transcript_22226/g.30911 Transcript_22226/m.30911 type:complete len:117 (-) Transcript_22226:249-599(-)
MTRVARIGRYPPPLQPTSKEDTPPRQRRVAQGTSPHQPPVWVCDIVCLARGGDTFYSWLREADLSGWDLRPSQKRSEKARVLRGEWHLVQMTDGLLFLRVGRFHGKIFQGDSIIRF